MSDVLQCAYVDQRPDIFGHPSRSLQMSRSTRRSGMRAVHLCHEFVVINSVEELRQVDIDDELIALGDMDLRLCHHLVGRAPRPEALAVLAERRVP